ncbi:hypothetical protein MAC_00839 [Metarhizium acridum CQMa 102]|uniref:Uncharacterized protein n=1 Tax=Metarhizium acridum (strain CQMa 102) TaxID=655827 RepID=E9DTK1_METAQ|nr:uncharacterized protein MAC_00839 [Metarhizium acridum CQMa 102]EFY93056.1 hypothetical protein MAC_00839 [Metarhizium acridum CQMa 102]
MADDSKSGKSRSSRVANSVNEKAQGILKEDLNKVKGVAYQALKSKAYLYPIKARPSTKSTFVATHRG